jgi:hypothetical protein
MRLFGYTLGQVAVIGLIAVLSVYAVKRLDSMVKIPGLHQIAEGS